MTVAETDNFSSSRVYVHARKKTGTAGGRSVYSNGRNQNYELWLEHVKTIKYKPETGKGLLHQVTLTMNYKSRVTV
jgi:hypothetical protein